MVRGISYCTTAAEIPGTPMNDRVTAVDSARTNVQTSEETLKKKVNNQSIDRLINQSINTPLIPV